MKRLIVWFRRDLRITDNDAGMRELNATGYLHNRARMIVAMFLTKDLYIHWREGEKHFMQKLVDGDVPANNGGWQWSAGTGQTPPPFSGFRIPGTRRQATTLLAFISSDGFQSLEMSIQFDSPRRLPKN
jgi:deoxyribodipyrimidine photolyase